MLGSTTKRLDSTKPISLEGLVAGVDNLNFGCLGDVSGKKKLVICEEPSLNWYDVAVSSAVIKQLLNYDGHVNQILLVRREILPYPTYKR